MAPAAARVVAPAGTRSRGIASRPRTESAQLPALRARGPLGPRAPGCAQRAPPTPKDGQCARSAGSRGRGGAGLEQVLRAINAAGSALLALQREQSWVRRRRDLRRVFQVGEESEGMLQFLQIKHPGESKTFRALLILRGLYLSFFI